MYVCMYWIYKSIEILVIYINIYIYICMYVYIHIEYISIEILYLYIYISWKCRAFHGELGVDMHIAQCTPNSPKKKRPNCFGLSKKMRNVLKPMK